MGDLIEPVAEPTRLDNVEKAVIHSQKAGGGFNWLLPLLGAIGFGLGFAISHAITRTQFDMAKNAFAHYGIGSMTGLGIIIFRGLLVGGLGGGLLGFSYKNKIHVLYFALSGAIGFSIAFTLVTLLDPQFVPDLGRAIMHLMGGLDSFSSFETSLSHGLGAGIIVGGIGGLILGLGSSYARIASSLLLCVVGTFWFGNAFAFAYSLQSEASYQFDGFAGAIGGALFGLTLSLCAFFSNRIYEHKKAT